MSSIAIVVSGLPASGKSTLGKQIAHELGYCFLDKDDFLERLFELDHLTGSHSRKVLSRKSDKQFQAAAEAETHVVLVSHWRPGSSASSSGTPSGWVSATFDTVVELYCSCPRQIAAERFLKRTRHAAHGDSSKDLEEVEVWMQQYDGWFPLNPGQIISVDAQAPTSTDEVAQAIRSIILNADPDLV